MAHIYSRSKLQAILVSFPPKLLHGTVWKMLTQLGISRWKPTRRGCRAGCRKQRLITPCIGYGRYDFSKRQDYKWLFPMETFAQHQAGSNLHFASTDLLNIHLDTSAGINTNNLIVINRTPMLNTIIDSTLLLCSANVRSVKSKTSDLLDFIYSSDADLFAITETWLSDDDTAAKLEFIPSETHAFVNQNRADRKGGGTGLLFKKNIEVKKIDAGEKTSFEFSEWCVCYNSFKVRLSIIYRPPYSSVHPVTVNTFLQDFSVYLESVILTSEPLIILGDFNIHVCPATTPEAVEFLDLLTSMGLKQHVTQPTHEAGNTLDLVITREHDTVIRGSPKIGRYLSDHATVFCQLNVSKPRACAKKASYRKLKSIDIATLRKDLQQSDLCTRQFSDLDQLSSCYNSTLSSLLDKHAPLQSRTIVNRKRVPWFNNEIKDAIRARRKAEKKWLVSKSDHDLRIFKLARNHATYLMNTARCKYYTNHIEENSDDQRKLFRTTQALLREPNTVSFPQEVDPHLLANSFGDFFVKKIESINKSLNDVRTVPMTVELDEVPPAEASFSEFESLSDDEVYMLIKKAAKKSCLLDPMPTYLILQLLDVLLPVITTMINLSFNTGYFAHAWKEALVLPSLKKPGLDVAFKNFRPVSNLPYISKLSERAAACQLTQYMTDNDLHSVFQSAYKPNHSTETALLKVKNDILMNMNDQHVTLLVLLDLSAAFDTVHHDILIARLKNDLGIEGDALSWLISYLSDRSQRISINGGTSRKFPIVYGVPQGSCLGPLLFTVYTRKLFQVVKKHLPKIHCYADDTQLYLSFCPSSSVNAEVAVESMNDCIADIRNWMISDKLMLNDDKTEFVLIGTRQQLAKVDIDSISVGSYDVSPGSVVRNLGSWFDSKLTMSTHISKVCASSFYHLHNIKRIRKYLSVEATQTLVHALITSRVDYCNSLLFGLPDCQLNKLQRVLNVSARLIYKLPRFCHITPILCDLHWLPIRYRINFKIILLTFKAIHGLAPKYISDLVVIKSSTYNLRSADSLFLSVPHINTKKTLGDRAFTIAAPKLWNSLPVELRQINSIFAFKRQLKSYLFQLAYC